MNIQRLLFIVFVIISRASFAFPDDIDTHIPVNTEIKDKTFVLIISNENYKHEQTVPYALNDGDVFYIYCEKTLGIPKKNIKHLRDATLNDMNHELEWLSNIVNAYDGEASAIVYYSGHGMPDESSKEAFLLPVDGYSSDSQSGLSILKLYQQLGSMDSQRTLVLLDACFSGTQRDGSMLNESRGIAIKNRKAPVQGNLVVFSAAQGNETAYPYKEYHHGLFTYYVLDKINQSGGHVSLGELSDYVIKQVKRSSMSENGKSQTPDIVVASTNTEWRNWKLTNHAATEFEIRKPTQYSTGTMAANKHKNIERPSEKLHQDQLQANTSLADINYDLPAYTIEGAGTGIQGTYLVKVTITSKKPNNVTDDDFLKCAVHGILFKGFNGERQHQRPLAGTPQSEQEHALFYNNFFQKPYQQYGKAESDSRIVMKMGKGYLISALVSVMKDLLRKDLTQQGVIRGLSNGF